MKLEKMPNEFKSTENVPIGKGYSFENGTSMGFQNWVQVMNNISDICSNPEFIKSIENGSYNFLIIDDVSARVPGLIFRKIINEIYDKKNQPIPKVLFVPGQLRSTNPNISEIISNHINKCLGNDFAIQSVEKALVITDTISEGRTLKILSDALKKSDIDCDIVTTSIEGLVGEKKEEKKKEFEDIIGCKIYTATNDETANWSGTVPKPYSHGVKKNTDEMVSKKIPGVQNHINQARKMVDKISEEIIKQIDSIEPIPTDQERFKKNIEFIDKYWSLLNES